jgi:acyl carrier protein
VLRPPDPRLAQAFRIALELAPETEVETLAYGEHPHWDSVGHMALVAEIEDTYGVMLETSDVIGLTNYGEAVDLLQRFEVAA